MRSDREEQYRNIKLWIVYYRKKQSMTQEQLAEKARISRTHLSNLEAPNMPLSVSLDTLFDIADALDIPVSKLFQAPVP